MVVMAIVAILATGVVFMFANPSAKVKTQAFNLLAEFNMARSEAVTRNQDVTVTFLPGATDADQDGYRIWLDENADSAYTAGTDTLIRETFFPQKVQYYDPTALPTGGPATTPGGANLIGKSGIVLDDVAATEITNFSMEPDGTLEDGITENINVVIFVPKETHNVIYGAPYAITIGPSTGRVRINRWTSGAWATK